MHASLTVVSDVTLSFHGIWCIPVIIRRHMMNMEMCKNKGFSVYWWTYSYLASFGDVGAVNQKHTKHDKSIQNEVSCKLYNSYSFLKSANTLEN